MATSIFNVIRGTTAPYYRAATYGQQQQNVVRPAPNVRDDYERWYTEPTTSNRMVLSLRSGIHQEIGWALDRLCRLCDNEQFLLTAIPGLTDALFECPEWYVSEGYKETSKEAHLLFSPAPFQARKRRHALESLVIFRNATLNEPNADELVAHSHTKPLILAALHNLDLHSDENAEFLLYIIELLQAVAPKFMLQAVQVYPKSDFITPLQEIASRSSNRSLIIAALAALSLLFSSPSNTPHLAADSPAFEVAIRYLPLLIDKSLLSACLNYLYVHLSHPAMSKAFLLHAEMPNTLKLFVSILLSEQVEETVALEVGGNIPVPPPATATRDHDLSKEELSDLLEKPEPQRCYEWMKTMFVGQAEGELTQVDFWNLYKDVFSPHQERFPLLVASDVIKNVNVVFPQAQAMVLPGPPQKFVVRGVDRRKDNIPSERFKCQWDRSQCPASPLSSLQELHEHLTRHLGNADGSDSQCLWSTCTKPPLPSAALRAHAFTHLPSAQPSSFDSSDHPTSRTPPPPPKTTLTYRRPTVDPPSSSLTALLCIRILFRASFASTDTAPRVDAEHFGFPGFVEDTDDPDFAEASSGSPKDGEREGERRGRKAFMGVRRLIEGVRMRDEILMGWIDEMVDAGITGTL